MKVLLIVAALALAAPRAGAQKLHVEKSYPAFAVGPTGIVATIENGHEVTVVEITPGTPAAETKLAAGDVITVACDLEVDRVLDPRVPLGRAIDRAEAAGGRMELTVLRDGAPLAVTLELPALGGYSKTWPTKCEKSLAIIERTAEYVLASQREDGSFVFGSERPERDGLKGCLAGLFLLSLGDDDVLPAVKLQTRALAAKVQERPTHSNWHLGYQGILLAEYFLRTGDDTVLAGLEALCDQAIRAQAAGAWGHGGIPGPGYVQSGLMNSAGVPVLTTLILARECGVDVDEKGLHAAAKLFYRTVGHGCVPYGDHRSELWWSNTNGRNAKLACAFSLIDQPEFQLAASHLALLVADSYHQPEFGHTGGGFNVIWRGLASVHVPIERLPNYHRQLNELAWYYDLCRQPDGGFSILPTPPDNKRYQGLGWGTGAIGLTYTAPRRTLRITGKPRTRYSKRTLPLKMNWGTRADLVFFSTTGPGELDESADPRELYEQFLGKKQSFATVELGAASLRHYSPLVRTWAGKALGQRNDEESRAVIAAAARHEDPRVRRAAFDAVSGYDNWNRPIKPRASREFVSQSIVPAITRTLADRESAWWEIDGALFALGAAEPDDIRAHMKTIAKYARHDEWYLRDSAFWAIVGLGATITGEEFQLLADAYARSQHVFERASFDGGFKALLKKNRAVLDEEGRARAVATLAETTHAPLVADGYGVAGIHEAAHRTMMIMRHFEKSEYALMLDDFGTYLESWEPYYQHSKWLISGSKWQDGLLAVLDGLGPEGKPLRFDLQRVLDRYGDFDEKRMGKDGMALERTLRERLAAWDAANAGR